MTSREWIQGAGPLLLGYAAVLAGDVAFLIRFQVRVRDYLRSPLRAGVSMMVGMVIWLIFDALALQNSPLWLQNLVAYAFFLCFGFFVAWLVSLRSGGPDVTHRRGTVFQRKAAARATPDQLTFSGQPVPMLDETKHFKLIGTTGAGKSTAIRELLAGALDRGDRMVIADPDGGYLKTFYQPERGDVILNPFDPRSARWDLFSEIVELHDADELARSLIPEHEGPDAQWRNYARVFLTALLRQLHRAQEQDVGALYRLLMIAPAEDLRELLIDTPAGPSCAQWRSPMWRDLSMSPGRRAASRCRSGSGFEKAKAVCCSYPTGQDRLPPCGSLSARG